MMRWQYTGNVKQSDRGVGMASGRWRWQLEARVVEMDSIEGGMSAWARGVLEREEGDVRKGESGGGRKMGEREGLNRRNTYMWEHVEATQSDWMWSGMTRIAKTESDVTRLRRNFDHVRPPCRGRVDRVRGW